MIHAKQQITKEAGTIPAKRCLQYATGGCSKRHRKKPLIVFRHSESLKPYAASPVTGQYNGFQRQCLWNPPDLKAKREDSLHHCGGFSLRYGKPPFVFVSSSQILGVPLLGKEMSHCGETFEYGPIPFN